MQAQIHLNFGQTQTQQKPKGRVTKSSALFLLSPLV